ncbi:MAG TPA: hypothetical protein P5119_08845 [Candidatus Aminicenantes bacterium]|nr:hypothetical protein [Candidatus Aminicenantes bacterium]HRY65433.1 hypothetical protein [Candidatus Aminicenantes bacterium]HRZ72099.1 hypothetical protein [Candidatus Aminicenantes bacterium]
MKTDLAGLMEAYQAHLEDQERGACSGCPAPEGLVRLLERQAGRKERKMILDHVAGCVDCALLLKSALRLSGEIDRVLGRDGALRIAPREGAAAGTGGPRFLLGRRAAFGALAGALGLAIVTYSVIRLAEKPVVRGAAGPQVRLISPVKGASVPAGEIEFLWETVPQAARYSLEIFNGSLERLWRSGPLTEVRLPLPEDARGAIRPGESYFWRVTAVLKDGQELASKLAEFSVGKMPA